MSPIKLFPAALLAAATLIPASAIPAESGGAGFEIYTVTRQAVPVVIRVAGNVASVKTAQLSAQIPGRVIVIAGEEGDRFPAGAELVRIDDNALRAKLDAAVASRDAALMTMRNASVQLRREIASPRSEAATNAPGGMGMPAMMDQMFTNPMQNVMGMRSRGDERYSDVINRETQLAQAGAQRRQAEARIREIQASLRDARSLAPFAGVIETLYVEIGDTMQPGQPLLTFSETSAFQVHADIPVRLRPGLREGMILTVRLNETGPGIPAQIRRIFPIADRTQHTIRIEMDLPLGTQATVGQYAEVQVPDRRQETGSSLLIPQRAVIRKGGLPLVFTVGDDGKSRLRVVRLGESAGTDDIVVLSGVREGDRLIANPKPGMKAGTRVTDTPSASEQ